MVMEISSRLLKFKFHILFALAFSIMLVSLIYLAPSFVHVLAYFWPLLLSTALFLLAVVFIGQTSSELAPAEKTGEGILEFVAAAQPAEAVQVLAEECSTSGNTM